MNNNDDPFKDKLEEYNLDYVLPKPHQRAMKEKKIEEDINMAAVLGLVCAMKQTQRKKSPEQIEIEHKICLLDKWDNFNDLQKEALMEELELGNDDNLSEEDIMALMEMTHYRGNGAYIVGNVLIYKSGDRYQINEDGSMNKRRE